MRYILQRYASDCFPTCLAIIAGISHAKALKLVHPKRKKWSTYASDLNDKINVFRKLGFDVKKRYPKKLSKLKHHAILEIGKNLKETTHALVWDAINKRILDPARRKHRGIKYIEGKLLRAFEIKNNG